MSSSGDRQPKSLGYPRQPLRADRCLEWLGAMPATRLSAGVQVTQVGMCDVQNLFVHISLTMTGIYAEQVDSQEALVR